MNREFVNEVEVKFLTNYQVSQHEKYLKEIKEILISNNTSFIPSLFERIELDGTLEEKVNYRVNKRILEEYHYILATYQNRVVGFTEMKLADSLVYNENLYAINVGTSAIALEHQGKGIAKLLYNHLEELAVKFGVDVVVRSTWSLNIKQLKLYERFGYKEIARSHNERGEGNDLVKFCKWFN